MGSASRLGSNDSPTRSLRTGRPRTSRFGSCPRSDRDGTRRWYGRPGTRWGPTGRGRHHSGPPPSSSRVAPAPRAPARPRPGLATRAAGRRQAGPGTSIAACRARPVRTAPEVPGSDNVHVVVMGCGRVGSAIARRLEDIGHGVAVIDQAPEAFRRLGRDFAGRQVTGLGFDRQTLLDAGIDSAGAFAAVSSGDNSNIISARVARETFGVQHVVARIYDSKRAEVYERMGIPSVATVP